MNQENQNTPLPEPRWRDLQSKYARGEALTLQEVSELLIATRPQGEAAATVKESLTTEPAPADVERQPKISPEPLWCPVHRCIVGPAHQVGGKHTVGGCELVSLEYALSQEYERGRSDMADDIGLDEDARWELEEGRELAHADVGKEVAEIVTNWQWTHYVEPPEIARGTLVRRITRLVSQAEQRARQAGREEAIRECAEAMCPNSPCKKAILSKLTPPTEGGQDV